MKEKKIYISIFSKYKESNKKKRGNEVDNEMTSDRSVARQSALQWWD